MVADKPSRWHCLRVTVCKLEGSTHKVMLLTARPECTLLRSARCHDVGSDAGCFERLLACSWTGHERAPCPSAALSMHQLAARQTDLLRHSIRAVES